MIYTRMLTYNAPYAEKLLQVRPTGSQWGYEEDNEEIANGIQQLDWREYNDDPIAGMIPGVRYYNVSKEELLTKFPDATQDMLPLDYFCADRYGDRLEHIQQCIDDIEVSISPKTGNYELLNCDIEPKRIAQMDHIRDHEPAAWLAVGDAEDKNKNPVGDVMIWMIYPGQLTPALPPNWNGQMGQLILLDDWGGNEQPTFTFHSYAVKSKLEEKTNGS